MVYVGKSLNIFIRIKNHKISITSNKKKYFFINALKKYGWNGFDISILEQYDQIENNVLLEIEAYYIRKYDSTNPKKGYNIFKKSTGTGCFKHSEESKKKMSETSKKTAKRGKDHWLFSIPRTQETKEKMSQAKKGKYNGINNPNYGKKISEKSRTKMKNTKANNPQDFSFKFKPVKQINPNTKEIVNIYKSITEAAGNNKEKISSISIVCNNRIINGYKRQICNGFKWEFATKEEYDQFITCKK